MEFSVGGWVGVLAQYSSAFLAISIWRLRERISAISSGTAARAAAMNAASSGWLILPLATYSRERPWSSTWKLANTKERSRLSFSCISSRDQRDVCLVFKVVPCCQGPGVASAHSFSSSVRRDLLSIFASQDECHSKSSNPLTCGSVLCRMPSNVTITT